MHIDSGPIVYDIRTENLVERNEPLGGPHEDLSRQSQSSRQC